MARLAVKVVTNSKICATKGRKQHLVVEDAAEELLESWAARAVEHLVGGALFSNPAAF